MREAGSLYLWTEMVESLAAIAIIVSALSCMVGIAKPAEAFRSVFAILISAIATIMLLATVANLWSNLSGWQKFGLTAFGVLLVTYRLGKKRCRTKP